MPAIPYIETITKQGKRAKGSFQEADVCLILEGTYPYVSGGVSSWVHSLIRGLPEITFSLLVILPDEKEREHKYTLPDNVIGVYILYLNRSAYFERPAFMKTPKGKFQAENMDFHQHLIQVKKPLEPFGDSVHITKGFKKIAAMLEESPWNIPSMLLSDKNWQSIQDFYKNLESNCSFMDYYWTWRYIHSSIFAIMLSVIPPAKVYHTISTGYAGLFGARASMELNKPLLLTEHGIYTKEREIEISRSPWIYERDRHLFRAQEDIEIFKEMWIRSFQIMSKICYDTAAEIITLYTGNQRYQLEIGAPPDKLKIIPNGVDYAKLSRPERQNQPKKIIGFVGRVVPIKDVKTFLRASSLVLNTYPEAEIWLLGPTDEDEQYFRECEELVEHLDIGDKVTFWGLVNLVDYYPKIDILVLTSISEAQPLVILEAHCQEIPVVTTDVGACSELLNGFTDEDKALGSSGYITGLSNPTETAISILKILNAPQEAKAMGKAGKERVRLIYDLEVLFNRYRLLYQQYFDWKEEA